VKFDLPNLSLIKSMSDLFKITYKFKEGKWPDLNVITLMET
jgi:hypothetical protein